MGIYANNLGLDLESRRQEAERFFAELLKKSNNGGK